MPKRIEVNGYITNDEDAPIYREWYEMTVTSPSDVINELPKDGSEVTIAINSNGGEVDPAAQIYTALRNYSGQVTTQIESAAYSSASHIAMAGNVVQISPAAKMMIHNAKGGTWGGVEDMQAAAGELEATNRTIANIYAEKTGRTVDEFLELMQKETWLSPQDAMDLGMVDEVIDFKEPVTNSLTMVPKHSAIEKIKNLVAENEKLKTQNSQPKSRTLREEKLAILLRED